jgi:hypothetical protein
MGLIKTMKAKWNEKKNNETNEEYFERIKLIYENNIIAFIEQWKNKFYNKEDNKLVPKPDNIVISIFAKDDSRALTKENREKSNNYLKTLVKEENFKNYNVDDWKPEFPDEIIIDIQEIIKLNPKSQIIIRMAGHWWKDWSMSYNWMNFTKGQFDILFNLWPNVHIDIISCYSGYKDDDSNDNFITNLPNFADNNLWSLVLDSSLQPSMWWNTKDSSQYSFFQALEEKDVDWKFEVDYDWDGFVTYNEAVIYRMLNYNYSIDPISFYNPNKNPNDQNSNMIEIAKNGWKGEKNEKSNVKFIS